MPEGHLLPVQSRIRWPSLKSQNVILCFNCLAFICFVWASKKVEGKERTFCQCWRFHSRNVIANCAMELFTSFCPQLKQRQRLPSWLCAFFCVTIVFALPKRKGKSFFLSVDCVADSLLFCTPVIFPSFLLLLLLLLLVLLLLLLLLPFPHQQMMYLMHPDDHKTQDKIQEKKKLMKPITSLRMNTKLKQEEVSNFYGQLPSRFRDSFSSQMSRRLKSWTNRQNCTETVDSAIT